MPLNASTTQEVQTTVIKNIMASFVIFVFIFFFFDVHKDTLKRRFLESKGCSTVLFLGRIDL